jgi:hypothetical protein
LLAPVVGLLISFGNKTVSRRKVAVVATFYAVAISLWAAMAVLAPAENPILACSFLLLLPTGMILGLGVLASREHGVEPRGFEVQPKPGDKTS